MRPLAVLLLFIAACGTPTDDTGHNAGPDAGVVTPDAPNHPPNCVPKTCAQLGAECGSIADGCGHTLDCSYCLYQSDECMQNKCVCQPNCYMKACGDDGCGGSCGSCGSTESCNSYGKCIYQGAHTTPPSTWHCNAAYYDAGDGCDCNCGAADPDCGQAGQALDGCTGLSSPTCTSEGLCTGGGACHSVPGSAYLTHYFQIATAPTMLGGTVASGRYEGTDMQNYDPPGGISGYGGGDGVAIEISGTTWKRMRRPVGGYPAVDETFTASMSGNTLTLTRTCPSALTLTYHFTATATQLKIADSDSGGTRVITFTKVW